MGPVGLPGMLPVFLVVDKADLADRAEYGPQEVDAAARSFGAEWLLTSAKTGDHVEDAFQRLAHLAAERQLRLL